MKIHALRAALMISSFAPFAHAQFGRGGGDWSAVGGDAQRAAAVRTDAHISPENAATTMQFLWKLKLNGTPSVPAVSGRLITYKGFKDLMYIGTSADYVYSIDHTLGKVFWETHLPYDSLLIPVKTGTATCPAGMTASVSLAASLAPPDPAAARGGRGRGPGMPGAAGRGMAAAPAPTLPRPKRNPGDVYAVSSDGLIHELNQHTGADLVPAARFIRGNAKVHDVISISNVVYAVTSDGCGGAPNGVWSVDLADNMVNEYKTGDASVLGVAFATYGTVLATTTEGLVSLEPKTLKMKQQHPGAFSTTPMVFKEKDKEYVVAGSADGHLIVMDAMSLAVVSDVSAGAGKLGASLATWQDADKKRWIFAPRGNNIVAFKVGDDGTLQQGWTSREIMSPAPPIVDNGVVFALASGNRTSPAVLYAFNGETGKDLWNSGKSIPTYSVTGIATGASKVFVSTHDGTLYAFGYMLPRE
jgi:outer membrane protein assembly factor BamB